MKALQPNLNSEGKELIEKLLRAGHIKHKYAVRLQTVLLRANDKGGRRNQRVPGNRQGIGQTRGN
jgi:hypothetical protein